MKTLFVTSDVHSYFSIFKDALDSARYNKNNRDHILITCGDCFDRGNESVEMLDFLNSIKNKICIIGNHELLAEESLDRRFFYNVDYNNGTAKTLIDLNYTSDEFAKKWNEYKNTWKWCVEIGKFIFVHGWLPFDSRKFKLLDLKNASSLDFSEATWINGMEFWNNGLRIKNKTIVCGHWHTSYGHANIHHKGTEFGDAAIFEPFIDEGIIALDACTTYSNKCNVIKLEVSDEDFFNRIEYNY